jgi:hypothetical protein
MTPIQTEMFETAASHGWDWFDTPSGVWKFTRGQETVKVWFSAPRAARGVTVTYAEWQGPQRASRLGHGLHDQVQAVLRVLRL